MIRMIGRKVLSLTSSPPSPKYFIAQCSTSSSTYPTSSPTHFASQYTMIVKNTPVIVYWDLESCHIPSRPGVKESATGVAEAIKSAVRSVGIKGHILIKAFGNLSRLARDNRSLLLSDGVGLVHIPPDGKGKGSADSAIQIDLMTWASENPPPAHVFLVSSDGDFVKILHLMRLRKYNILLACKELSEVHYKLISAATVVWNWGALARGKNLIGRYFNQPPNELWYGSYEGPLEDAFTAFEARDYSMDVPRPTPHHDSFQHAFWGKVQKFVYSELGSVLIAHSKTRGMMACFLVAHGPEVLQTLTSSEAFDVVNLIISDRKWVRESPYLFFPFKVTSSAAGITSSP